MCPGPTNDRQLVCWDPDWQHADRSEHSNNDDSETGCSGLYREGSGKTTGQF